MKGIEPSYLAWEANALPLSYTRLPDVWNYVADASTLQARGSRFRLLSPPLQSSVNTMLVICYRLD